MSAYEIRRCHDRIMRLIDAVEEVIDTLWETHHISSDRLIEAREALSVGAVEIAGIGGGSHIIDVAMRVLWARCRSYLADGAYEESTALQVALRRELPWIGIRENPTEHLRAISAHLTEGSDGIWYRPATEYWYGPRLARVALEGLSARLAERLISYESDIARLEKEGGII
jgi:hypothetical protein